ncbi:MAG TPA: hypothetical protein VIO57_05535, partial [Chloroflexota bacterium]
PIPQGGTTPDANRESRNNDVHGRLGDGAPSYDGEPVCQWESEYFARESPMQWRSASPTANVRVIGNRDGSVHRRTVRSRRDGAGNRGQARGPGVAYGNEGGHGGPPLRKLRQMSGNITGSVRKSGLCEVGDEEIFYTPWGYIGE